MELPAETGRRSIQRLRLERLLEGEDFDGVVAELDRRGGLDRLELPELVMRGCAIQLGGASAPPLEEAEASFRAALERDPDYVPALLELGWYLYAVVNDAKSALPYFARAAALAERNLREAERGRLAWLQEEIEASQPPELACAFCGRTIEWKAPDPCQLTLVLGGSDSSYDAPSQTFFAHHRCLGDRLPSGFALLQPED